MSEPSSPSASSNKFEDLVSKIHKLFAQTYFAHAELENEEVSEEDKETLEQLDHNEILENFKELILVILNEKKQHQKAEAGDLLKTNQ
jgi:hypothetical protein